MPQATLAQVRAPCHELPSPTLGLCLPAFSTLRASELSVMLLFHRSSASTVSLELPELSFLPFRLPSPVSY